MSNEKTKRRFTAIDYFIILAVIAILVAAGLRIYEDRTADTPAGEYPVDDEEYIVSFESLGMLESAAKLLEAGDTFYLTGSSTPFGVLEDNPTITPAKIRVELENGELRTDVYAEKNGNNTKVDVTGTFRVKARRNSSNILFIGGSFYIAPNLPVMIFNNDTSLSFNITGIEKVS